MTSRKRSGSGSTKRPKEKVCIPPRFALSVPCCHYNRVNPLQVVYIYELLCRGEDPSADSPEFWNEFFLLQPNFESLEDQVSKLNNEQLQVVKPNLNTLFQKCIEMLDTSKGKLETLLV